MLVHGRAKNAFEYNVKTEHEEGQPLKQSLAIAYAMKRKNKMARGGPVLPGANDAQKSMRKAFKYAEGGDVQNQSPVNPHDSLKDDLVERIMKKMSPDYSNEARLSEGGEIANDTHQFESDFDSPNQFDDLVLRDDLEFSENGKNSGDELGDAQEDEDRKDIVSRVMASRKKKDKNPRPA